MYARLPRDDNVKCVYVVVVRWVVVGSRARVCVWSCVVGPGL